ncbi:isocitrate/isopropylmalate family dehydrogenase [Streptomyces thinghirensis]|nr:isocitrate/isopropylmalate family dehydrogenase [Streptomyces thinghirensis]
MEPGRPAPQRPGVRPRSDQCHASSADRVRHGPVAALRIRLRPLPRHRRLTLVDKPNVLRHSGNHLRERLESIAGEHPDIEAEILNVDAVALWMVRRPERFGVLVAENMFGDILSDLGAGVMGGLGLAPQRQHRRPRQLLRACARQRSRHGGAGPGQPHGDADGHGSDARPPGPPSAGRRTQGGGALGHRAAHDRHLRLGRNQWHA